MCRFLACFAGGEEQKRSSGVGRACGILSGSKNKEEYSNVVHKDFVNSTLTFLRDTKYTNHEALPSLHDAYAKFIEVYPKYEESRLADDIRGGEYNHLKSNDHVCMDYFGMGLFLTFSRNWNCPPLPSTSPILMQISLLKLAMEPQKKEAWKMKSRIGFLVI